MAFQIKSFLSITASMINRLRASTQRTTDYNPGSVVRTMMEATAQEIDELYQQMLNGLREAIPISVYTSFNFPPLAPVAASNLVRVSVSVQSTADVISAGTLLTRADGSLAYTTTADVAIPAGASFADVPVVANVVGPAGNMAAGGQFTMSSPPPGFVSASNLSPFTNGQDSETPDAQKIRFNAYVQTLSRGTTAALLYALTRLTFLTDSVGHQIEHVATANIDEPYKTDPTQPPGLVNAYIHNGTGGTSQALVAQAAQILAGYTDSQGNAVPGYQAAGVQVVVYASAEIALDVVGMLTIAPTYSQPAVVAQVQAVLFTYIQQIPVGQPYLAAVANDMVMQVPGVWNWMPVSPVAYVACPFNAKLMPGNLQVIGWLQADTTIRTTVDGVLA